MLRNRAAPASAYCTLPGRSGPKRSLPASAPVSRPKVHRASCSTKAPGAPIKRPPPLTERQARTTPDDNGDGQSADKTLGWDWKVEKDGSRKFRVYQWKGGMYAQVLYNDVPAPPSK